MSIDISYLVDEVEAIDTVNLSATEEYPVFKLDLLPVSVTMKVTELFSRLAETEYELISELNELYSSAKDLAENDPRHNIIQTKELAIQSRMLPLFQEFIETVCQMPKGRWERNKLV
jgi:hypothetical protein